MKQQEVFDNTLKRYRYAIRLAKAFINKKAKQLADKLLHTDKRKFIHFRKEQLTGAVIKGYGYRIRITGPGIYPLSYTYKHV